LQEDCTRGRSDYAIVVNKSYVTAEITPGETKLNVVSIYEVKFTFSASIIGSTIKQQQHQHNNRNNGKNIIIAAYVNAVA